MKIHLSVTERIGNGGNRNICISKPGRYYGCCYGALSSQDLSHPLSERAGGISVTGLLLIEK